MGEQDNTPADRGNMGEANDGKKGEILRNEKSNKNKRGCKRKSKAESKDKQAGAELYQAQFKLELAKHGLSS